MRSIGFHAMQLLRLRRAQARKRRSLAARIRAGGGTLGALARCDAGGILSTFGLVTPILLMGAAAAVDYGMFERGRSRLQAQVDAAAIAAAREMQMAQANTT